MNEILGYVRARSEQGAVAVEDDIFEEFELLELLPEGAPVDEHAPAFPQPAAQGRRAVVGNYEILDAFPVEYEGDLETVAILFVRDARRDLLGREEIRQRFEQIKREHEIGFGAANPGLPAPNANP